MPDIESALYAYLSTYPALVALISTRIYPDELPQTATYPAVTYIKVSDVKLHTLAGQSYQEQPMYQFTVHALTKASVKAVAAAIKVALIDYRGTLSGVVIQHARLENELSSLEVSADGITKVQNIDLEFEVKYEKR